MYKSPYYSLLPLPSLSSPLSPPSPLPSPPLYMYLCISKQEYSVLSCPFPPSPPPLSPPPLSPPLYLCISKQEHSVLSLLPCQVIQFLQVLVKWLIVITSHQFNLQQRTMSKCTQIQYNYIQWTCMHRWAYRYIIVYCRYIIVYYRYM